MTIEMLFLFSKGILGLFGLYTILLGWLEDNLYKIIAGAVCAALAIALTVAGPNIKDIYVEQGEPIEVSGTVIDTNYNAEKYIVIEDEEGERIVLGIDEETLSEMLESIPYCVVGDKVKVKYLKLDQSKWETLLWESESDTIVTDIQIVE